MSRFLIHNNRNFYNMEEIIPQVVKEEANDLIEQFGESFKTLGPYKGKLAYLYKFPEDAFTGFPYVFLYDGTENVAVGITGFEALDIISSIG